MFFGFWENSRPKQIIFTYFCILSWLYNCVIVFTKVCQLKFHSILYLSTSFLINTVLYENSTLINFFTFLNLYTFFSIRSTSNTYVSLVYIYLPNHLCMLSFRVENLLFGFHANRLFFEEKKSKSLFLLFLRERQERFTLFCFFIKAKPNCVI